MAKVSLDLLQASLSAQNCPSALSNPQITSLAAVFKIFLSKLHIIQAMNNLLQEFLHLVASNQIIKSLGKN